MEVIEQAGWRKDRQKGSHAVFMHAERSGRLVVPMHPGDFPKGTVRDIEEGGNSAMTDFPIVLELEDDGRYSVSTPDLPGCYSWGATREEAMDHIREAIEVWIESAKADGEAIPKPGSSLAYVRVAS